MNNEARVLTRDLARLHLITHPLAAYKLALMRDPKCSTNKFRTLAKELSIFLTYEATRKINYKINSTISDDDTSANVKIVVVPIIRSGLPMAEGAIEILPCARIGHFGFRRVDNHKVEKHLIALPTPENAHYIIYDTVIGTGNTADMAVSILKEIGTKGTNITFCSLLISPKGASRVLSNHDDVEIHTVSVEALGENGFVIPGFGSDENDKMFGIR